MDAEERRQKVTRLDLLKKEKEIVQNLRTLSFDCIDKCVEHFDHEIECIEVYGAPNREVKEGGDQ